VSGVGGVAEPLHQRVEHARRVLQGPAAGRAGGPAEAGEGRDHEVEDWGVGRGGAGQRFDEAVELVEAAGPAVDEE